MAEVRYVELEGNPTFTDRKKVANIEKAFLRTAKKNPGITWVVREQGFGKEGQNQWSQPRKDVYVLGATKTKDEYWKRKALGKKKGGLPKYDPQKAVPRTTAAATFFHTAHRENQKLQRELSASDLTDAQKNAEYHKRKINVQVERVRKSDIKYFQEQGHGKKAFALAAEARDKRIKKITGAGVRITESAEFEGKYERHARLMFEGIQEGRKAAKLSYLDRAAIYGLAEDGQPKLVPNEIQITDEFIDEVNARKFGTVKEQRAFKAGALKFLQNKELHQQINTPDVKTFTPQRLEDTRSWHSGSSIQAFESVIPNYIHPDPSKIETKFVGNTLINALSEGGPETSETVTLADPSADQDYGLFIDDEIFESRSSFVNMLPDETVPGQEFNYNIDEGPVPVQITSYAEELQASEEPTIHQTLVNRTKGEVTLTHDDPNSGKWSDKAHARVGEQLIETATGIKSTYRVPNRIYYSQHVDTGLTAADLKLKATDPVQYAKVRAGSGVVPPDMSTMITSSMARIVDMGVPVTGSKGTDAVQSFLKGDAFTEEGDVKDQGNVAPSVKKGAPGLLESFREGTDFIEIEQAASRGFRGKKTGITSANPAQFEGQTFLSTSKPKYEVGTDMPGGEKGYTMTAEEITRQQAIDRRNAAALGIGVKPIITKKQVGGGHHVNVYTDPKLPISERESLSRFAKFVTEKTAEYKARVAAGTQEDFIQGLQDKKSGIRVISGGQIGADLIGLEQAKELGFKTGGTAPKGFQTSTGPNLNLSKTFNLTEISDQAISDYTGNEKFYGPRTEQNVLKSDITFLFTNPKNRNSPGSALTRKLAKQHGRPLLENPSPKQVQSFISKKGPNATINIAGNREFTNKAAIRNALAALSSKVTPKVATATTPTKSLINVVDDVDTWKDVAPAPINKNPSIINDYPGNVYEGGSQMGASELLMDDQLEEMKAQNAKNEAAKKIKQSEEAFGPRGKPVVTQQQLIDSGEVPPDYFDEKYMGKKGGRNQTEFQREDQSRALEKWRKDSGQTDWRGNVIKPTVRRDKLISGDLWDQEGYKIVSTNLGGVHGRGLAKQAQTQGFITSANKSFVTSPKGGEVITLAVKGAAPETAKVPGKSFSESTTGNNVKLMISEVNKLIEFARKNPTKRFNMPFIGLGFGEGNPEVIKPILARAVKEPNIFLVSKDAATVAKHKSSFAPGVRSDSTSRPPAHLPKYPATNVELKKTTIETKPQADIELKKSAVLSKETGKPTFTTKGEKVKTAVKKGGTLLKKPGSTTLGALGAITLMSPLIGAYGSLKKTNIEEAESQSAYPLYKVKPREITAGDYKQSLWHRLAPDVFRSVKEERKYKKSLISGDI